jgi:hypothetical protein
MKYGPSFIDVTDFEADFYFRSSSNAHALALWVNDKHHTIISKQST